MTYIKVTWKHELIDQPVELWSELTDTRWEKRKVYFFKNNTVEYADGSHETGSVFLGLEPVPSVQEINLSEEFEAVEVEANRFEEVWMRAKISQA